MWEIAYVHRDIRRLFEGPEPIEARARFDVHFKLLRHAWLL